MIKKTLALSLALLMLAATLCGCQSKQKAAAPTATPAPQVTLTVMGSWPDFRALDITAKAFSEKYPNCTITYEFLQNYYDSLEKRLMADDGGVDLFVTTNIQEGNALQPYALDLYERAGIDLSSTFDGLIENFLYRGAKAGEKAQLYALPLGAEMRGMYVNKTLLDSLNIAVPTNQQTLLAACQTLKDNGYIAFHGNPGSFSQLLLYPWICSLIANAPDAKAAYAAVEARDTQAIADMLRAPYELLYTLVENNYYDYKTAQSEQSLFLSADNESYARDFLNIVKDGEGYKKLDDIGRVAFMPSAISLESVIAKTKDDYHSAIEYVFIPSPVGAEGGYVYLSPAHGIAINKNSKNAEWAERFVDFLFQAQNAQDFAQAFNVIPNTKEAFSYISTRFNVPDARISHLGQVTFSYGFYDAVLPSMVNLSKANNPKYMQVDGEGKASLYPLETYIDQLKASLSQP